MRLIRPGEDERLPSSRISVKLLHILGRNS